jgi:alanyl-tRNA synthetase
LPGIGFAGGWPHTRSATCGCGRCSTPGTTGWLRSWPLADLAAAALAAEDCEVVEAHWRDRDMAFLQRVARTLAGLAPSRRALLTAEGEGESHFVVVAGEASGRSADELGPCIAEALGGRGGGRGQIYQGKATSLEGRDQAIRILSDA